MLGILESWIIELEEKIRHPQVCLPPFVEAAKEVKNLVIPSPTPTLHNDS